MVIFRHFIKTKMKINVKQSPYSSLSETWSSLFSAENTPEKQSVDLTGGQKHFRKLFKVHQTQEQRHIFTYVMFFKNLYHGPLSQSNFNGIMRAFILKYIFNSPIFVNHIALENTLLIIVGETINISSDFPYQILKVVISFIFITWNSFHFESRNWCRMSKQTVVEHQWVFLCTPRHGGIYTRNKLCACVPAQTHSLWNKWHLSMQGNDFWNCWLEFTVRFLSIWWSPFTDSTFSNKWMKQNLSLRNK